MVFDRKQKTKEDYSHEHCSTIRKIGEWGSWRNEEYHHAAMMMSCDENADLLVPENWSFTEPKKFTPSDAPELESMSEYTIAIEGTPVVSPDGKLLNFMRFEKPGYAIVYEANIENPEEILARNVLTLMVSADLDNWEVVEHVLANDSTRGYAIFIENMLEIANQVADEQEKKTHHKITSVSGFKDQNSGTFLI